MKIIHTADIHLTQYGDERWEALQRLITIGKQEGIELFVVSGDLFDHGVDAEALRPRIRELFSDTGFKICLIPGNHDSASYTGGMYFGEDAVIITDLNKPYAYKDVMIWGIPFESADRITILHRLRSIADRMTPDKKHIMLYHRELLDAFYSRTDFGAEGDERYMPVRLSYFNDLPIDYVLAGHFHRRFDVRQLEGGDTSSTPAPPSPSPKRRPAAGASTSSSWAHRPGNTPSIPPTLRTWSSSATPLPLETPWSKYEKTSAPCTRAPVSSSPSPDSSTARPWG